MIYLLFSILLLTACETTTANFRHFGQAECYVNMHNKYVCEVEGRNLFKIINRLDKCDTRMMANGN